MPSTSLIKALSQDFPGISFTRSDTFLWSPEEQTVYYKNTSDIDSLLHEVAHAALGHSNYTFDVELLKMERAAWSYASDTLAPKYGLSFDKDIPEAMLDTYRDWLHSRSLCPNCEATGLQIDKKHYKCLACTSSWRVNEAKSCGLRRYLESTPKS